MSIWSAVKYTLNSTLGTEDFKPLDRMYKESLRLQGTTAAISEIKTLPTSSSSVGEGFTIGDYGGTVNVCVHITRSISDDFSTVVAIYVNGVKTYSVSVYSTITEEQKATVLEYIPISVEPGDIITAYASKDTGTYSQYWHLCGSLNPTGALVI